MTHERIPTSVFASSLLASAEAARQIADLIRDRAREGRRAVLGLATGSTPTALYAELIRLHRAEGLSFRNVVSFNLDEYWPMPGDSLQSYRRFMQEHLFDHIDLPTDHANVPDGSIPRHAVSDWCDAYEHRIKDAGGIDLQLLGVGRTGHIGFNEPGSSPESRTRLITLDRVTRMDAASDFFGERHVPRQALTMGVGTILDARRIILLAFGENKASIIRKAVEGDISPAIAASYLQRHPDARAFLDPAAAAELTRCRTPWLLGPIADQGLAWDAATTKKAVIWLARELKRPILKLTDEEYNEHGLQDLLAARGSAYDINIEVFRSLQSTITGWPGGKPTTSAPATQDSGPSTLDSSFPKRVLVFSPHPDDDVISMGGTFIRLCDQGHDVHVAYQTSGDIAVWDEAALRHVDFVREFAHEFPKFGRDFARAIEDRIEAFLARKAPGSPDTPELQRVKALIRRTEARAAARYSGVRPDNIHFLDLPFYQTGRVRKNPLGERDIAITLDLLQRIKPHHVYAAGDLSDPHGTHRVCLAIVVEALKRLAQQPADSGSRTKDPRLTTQDSGLLSPILWLYRGAWQEWPPEAIEMAVPLSPDEVRRKRYAIFKHESQKDSALFPGPSDAREFWQRAEERNRQTARIYDQLGLAEYEAIEGFVKWREGMA